MQVHDAGWVGHRDLSRDQRTVQLGQKLSAVAGKRNGQLLLHPGAQRQPPAPDLDAAPACPEEHGNVRGAASRAGERSQDQPARIFCAGHQRGPAGAASEMPAPTASAATVATVARHPALG